MTQRSLEPDPHRFRGPRRIAALAVIVAFLPLATVGCFGRFQLVRNVYHWNQQVSPNKWNRWIAFLVLNVVPVYGFATLVDLTVVNEIEFWSGHNPAIAEAGHASRVVRAPDGSTATLTPQANGTLALTLRRPDGLVRRMVLARSANALTARAPDGTLLARVTDVDGHPALVGGRLAQAH